MKLTAGLTLLALNLRSAAETSIFACGFPMSDRVPLALNLRSAAATRKAPKQYVNVWAGAAGPKFTPSSRNVEIPNPHRANILDGLA